MKGTLIVLAVGLLVGGMAGGFGEKALADNRGDVSQCQAVAAYQWGRHEALRQVALDMHEYSLRDPNADAYGDRYYAESRAAWGQAIRPLEREVAGGKCVVPEQLAFSRVLE